MATTRLCVLYGSQTGTAQDVAELIWRDSKKMGCVGPVLPMDEYNIKRLIEEKFVIFVCATTGQGDEPDNMKTFWRFLLRKDLPQNSLKELHFAVLGLGDSSYTKYNYTAKRLYKRLVQLSGKPILPLGLCDDQHDFGPSATYLPWLQDLWQTLYRDYNFHGVQDFNNSEIFKWTANISEEDSQPNVEVLKWPLKDAPNIFELKENKRVTAEDHFQDVRLISFDCGELRWQPGDVLVIRPWNSKDSIERLFELFEEAGLNFGRDTVVKFSQFDEEMPLPTYYREPLPLELVAKYIWDLNAVPRQRVCELLALNCKNELEKEKLLELSKPEGLEEMINYVIRPKRTILEVLYDFPHAVSGLTIPVLFEMFHVIKPRCFSIASIPETGFLQILVAIVEYKTILSKPRQGLCTSWLRNLCVGQKIFGCIQRGTMKIPRDIKVPIVMVGPGTGVAPLRSLLLEREFKNETTKNMFLFFGCRGKCTDFYFKEDFQRLEGNGVANCFFAFSRDQPEKRYVQHVIEEQKEVIRREIFEKNGVILLAGSSKNMPTQVKGALTKVFGNEEYLQKLIKEGRYQEETWS